MHSVTHFQKLIEKELSKLNHGGKPQRLYDPIRYMISLGGKRLRPALLLMSHELFDGKPEQLLKPALGIEVFHNFTLLHDDIMDKAPLRRTRETVHKKWNTDVAILSGDAMFVQSCQLMMQVNEKHLRDVMSQFFNAAIEVCEGQQYDMDFETENSITIDEYMEMIRKKTASLIGCATSIGAICARAKKADTKHMYEFGKNLGIAFQLLDDILDVYGDQDKFGKQVGGDILSNKKTFLLLTALKKAKGKNKSMLSKWLRSTNYIPQQKIAAVISIYDNLEVRKEASEKMFDYYQKALKELSAVSVPEKKKQPLYLLSEKLMVREK